MQTLPYQAKKKYPLKVHFCQKVPGVNGLRVRAISQISMVPKLHGLLFACLHHCFGQEEG